MPKTYSLIFCNEVLIPLIKEELKQYVPNNFACALGSTVQGGCLCVKQKDLDYLTSRGGNMPLK